MPTLKPILVLLLYLVPPLERVDGAGDVRISRVLPTTPSLVVVVPTEVTVLITIVHFNKSAN